MPTYEISDGLDAWLRSPGRGISSNTIVQHLTGFPALAGSEPSHPHDVAEQIEDLRSELHETGAVRMSIPAEGVSKELLEALGAKVVGFNKG